MTRIDPTVVIERMARRLRTDGAAHPVAGAMALAARGHSRLDPDVFATTVGLSVEHVRSAERGTVAFGDLSPTIGLAITATGADLMALADLETLWREGSSPTERAADP